MSEPTRNEAKPKRAPRRPKSRSLTPELSNKANKSPKKPPTGSKSKTRSKAPKVKEVKNDYRYLEIIKLLKYHHPITINGVPTSKITSPLKEYIHQMMTNDATVDIYLSFRLQPSDPDFPYDVETLNFSLRIPGNYPYRKDALPTIVVLNEEIPRGFAVNVEVGFKKIAGIAIAGEKYVISREEEDEEIAIELVEGKGLLSQIKTLDKYLEEFLKEEKKQTFKFITFKEDKKKNEMLAKQEQEQQKRQQEKLRQKKIQEEQQQNKEVDAGVIRRRNELIEEMMNKLGSHLKLFSKNSNENKYQVSIPIYEGGIPELWRFNRELKIIMHIPIDYPGTPVTLSPLNNFNTNLMLKYKKSLENQESTKLISLVEEAKFFEKKMISNFNKSNFAQPAHQNLVYVVNYLANNLVKLGLVDEYSLYLQNMKKCIV